MLIFTRSAILAQILFWAGFFGSVGFAIAAPQVFILHSPIQPENNQQVTYTATANDPQGIKSIVISVERRHLMLYQNQKISEYNSTTDLKTCTYSPPFPTSTTCTVNDSPYPDDSHIGYKATATSGAGETSSEGYIYFAAGNFPFPEDPIPIYVRGDQAAKIDLVFIPDVDYGQTNWQRGFMDDVTALIKHAFFSDRPVARKIRNRPEMWNFYMTYYQGDAEPNCNRTMPYNWTTVGASANSGFIVHKTDMRDCSGIGDGSVFSAERIVDPSNERSLAVPIHELGHSAFSLADEYFGGYLFHLPLPSHNVFPSKKMCQDNARAYGWSTGNCKKIGKTSWYRSDDGQDIMEDSFSADNEFGPSDRLRIDWYYDLCTNQNH